MADYIPLELPTLVEPVSFTKTANFLKDSSVNIIRSGNSFLQSLTDLKNVDFGQVGNLVAFPSVVIGDSSVSALSSRPARPDINVNVQSLLDKLTSLTIPNSPPVNAFAYTEPGYAGTLHDPLVNKILVDLVSGGYGIDTTDEIALYNRARDRETLATQTQIDEIKRDAVTTSFPMPQGAMFAAIMRARQAGLEKASSLSRDIMLNRSKLYVENRQFIIEKALASDAQSIALYNAIQQRGVEVAKTQVSLAIALYESGLRFFQYQVDAINKQISTVLEVEKMKISVYGADIQAYASLVNAVSIQAQMNVRQSELVLDAAKIQYQSLTEQVRFRLQQLVQTVENSRQINEFGVEFFRTALGSAMSGISGLSVQTGAT
jgi:hypothetical protein